MIDILRFYSSQWISWSALRTQIFCEIIVFLSEGRHICGGDIWCWWLILSTLSKIVLHCITADSKTLCTQYLHSSIPPRHLHIPVVSTSNSSNCISVIARQLWWHSDCPQKSVTCLCKADKGWSLYNEQQKICCEITVYVTLYHRTHRMHLTWEGGLPAALSFQWKSGCVTW